MAGATRGGDCGKRKTRATLTDAKKRVHKKKLAETAIETSQERLTSNNKAMSSFFQRFTVNEEDNSAHQINENDLEINPTEDDIQIHSEEQTIEEADKEDIIEIFTGNIRHEIRNPVIANLDLGKEYDSGELLDNKD